MGDRQADRLPMTQLLESEYWAVLAYILTQNQVLPAGTTLGCDNAARIPLAQ